MITEHAQILKKSPSWLYKSAAQLYIDRKFPRHLFIETTANCNLRCEYCPREKITKHMDFGLFKAVIDEASQYGNRSFSLHLFGEPLLYPRILDAIEYIKRKNRRHTVLLTTNGTLLNRYADELIRLKVDKIIWSWRPEAKFEKVSKKLRESGIFVVRLIKETVPKEDFERWKTWPKVEIRNLHNYAANIDLSLFTSAGSNAKDADSKAILNRWPCYHLWLAPAVAWNGNFLMCCSDPHQKEVFGNVKQTSVSSLWEKLDGVRNAHLKGEYSGICSKCDVWKQYPDIFFDRQKIKGS